jgi:hypothetical protein
MASARGLLAVLAWLLLLSSVVAEEKENRPAWLIGRWRHEAPFGLVKIRQDLNKDGTAYFRMQTGKVVQEEKSSWAYQPGKLLFWKGKPNDKPKDATVWKIQEVKGKKKFVWNPEKKTGAQEFRKVVIPAPLDPGEALKQPAPKNLEKFLDECFAELQELQLLADEKWGFGDCKDWKVDQKKGTITFTETSTGHKKVVGKVQIIGSFNSADDTWLWGWANQSIARELRKDAETVKQYGQKHKLKKLTEKGWDGNVEDGWRMAALAAKLVGGQGVYRGPAGKLYIFMIVRDLKAMDKE